MLHWSPDSITGQDWLSEEACVIKSRTQQQHCQYCEQTCVELQACKVWGALQLQLSHVAVLRYNHCRSAAQHSCVHDSDRAAVVHLTSGYLLLAVP